MKKNKSRSVGNILESFWSSKESLTKPKSKNDKCEKKKNGDVKEDTKRVEYENASRKIKEAASRSNHSASIPIASDTSDSDLRPINNAKSSGRHNPVAKSFSVGDMLARRKLASIKKSDSMKSIPRPERPSFLSLKTPLTRTNTIAASGRDKRNQRFTNLKNINNAHSYSCNNVMKDAGTRNTYRDEHCNYSTSNLACTTLELGPTVYFPGPKLADKSVSTAKHEVTNSDDENQVKSSQNQSPPDTHIMENSDVYRSYLARYLLTHKEKRKTLKACKSLDIDSQEDISMKSPAGSREDIDLTGRMIGRQRRRATRNLSECKTDSREYLTMESHLPQTKSKKVISQSYDDILELNKTTKAMETYSSSEKDYLKVPQRGQSVDCSLLGSDLINNERKQRFRSYSSTYAPNNADEECSYYSDKISSNSWMCRDNIPFENTNNISNNKSKPSPTSPTRKASFVISPSNSSPPPNPFTFNIGSPRQYEMPQATTSSKSELAVSKSLDIDSTSPPRRNPNDYGRMCLSADSKPNADANNRLTRKPPRSPVSFPRFLSHASEAMVSPACDTCSPQPNKIFNRLARRFSLRRKSSKEKNKKGGSVDDLLKWSLGVGDLSRKSLESDTSMCSHTTDSDMSSLHEFEHESLYRGVIRCLLHPLGSPGTEIGLRPGDLLDHVKLVFDVPHPDHAFYIREELQNVPNKVQASITLLEAKNLTWTEDHGGVYCLLTQAAPSKATSSNGTNGKSPKNSPRGSPKNSPRSSPKFVKSPTRSPSMDYEPVRSHTSPNTRDPKWNECFHIDLNDPASDEINIFVCYYDSNNYTPYVDATKQPEKGGTLKTLFKNLLQAGNDHDKNTPGCFGRVDLPIRDIPTESCDRWFNILPIGSSNKHKPVGQLRMQVAVSSKHATMNNYFCAEDYHQASLLEHKYAAADIMDTDGLDLTLSPQAQKILNIFAVANGISKLSQKIMNLTVFLELVFSRYSHTVTDSVLHRAMEDVQMTWCEMQVRGGGDFLEKMPLCDAEICLYRSATRRYIDVIMDKLDEMPVLFPPSMDTIHNLKAHFGIGLHLLELDVWDAITSPQRDLASALVNKLQRDVRVWMDTHLDSIHLKHGAVKDVVIPEVEALADVTNTLVSSLTPLGVVEQFFLGLDVKYYRMVYFESERKLSLKVREVMLSLDKYQTRYHNYRVNLTRSCRLSIKLFLAVRSYYNTIKDAFDERDFFRLSIPSYQDWFQEAVVFWLQTFRTECTSRIQKALEIDKDLVLVTSQLKYSNSSVDAQACFSEITQEWRQIDIKDADTAVMGVTKIVDMICDGARVYASKIQTILERNCYYDGNQTQFDVTERMCITLNNIEHVRMFLSQLPELLDIEDVTRRMGLKHEDEEIGLKSLDTLVRLIQNADADVLEMSSGILRKVCQKMSVEVKHNMDRFLVKTPELSAATDKVIDYLNTNLETLQLRLSETIFPHMASQLWIMVAQLFDEHVLVGKPPDYYAHMQQHLRALTMFFCGWCPSQSDPFINFHTPLLEGLRERLEISSWKTERLMREYLHNLCSHMSTPVDYLGHLAVKTAYIEETRGNVTVYVKVIQGIDLPGLDSSGLSDPYVIVSVQPQEIFGLSEQRTKVIGQTLQPVFNTTFMFPNIPRECLAERGNCILLSVMDQDVVTQDDFAGEVVIALDSIQTINMNESVDIAPALLMPLKRPQMEPDGPFQVLRERVRWDKSAKNFIKSRMRYIENQPNRTDDSNVRERLTSLFKFWNNSTSPKSESAVT